ncbi:hypothetical protein D1007_34249 [Hordeum vulgare]|nr:hypothetical protein D1007_34249 [Hordeum vulgare]
MVLLLFLFSLQLIFPVEVLVRDSTISIKIKAAGGGRKQGFHNWLHCLKEKNSYMILVTAHFGDVFAPCFQAKL